MNLNNELTSKNLNHCPCCNYPIAANDTICKHCFEYRNQKEPNEETVSLKDSTLSSSDWIIIFFCEFIGILLSFFYFVIGENLRGKKVLKYSLFIMLCKIVASYPIYYILKTFHNMLKINI